MSNTLKDIPVFVAAVEAVAAVVELGLGEGSRADVLAGVLMDRGTSAAVGEPV